MGRNLELLGVGVHLLQRLDHRLTSRTELRDELLLSMRDLRNLGQPLCELGLKTTGLNVAMFIGLGLVFGFEGPTETTALPSPCRDGSTPARMSPLPPGSGR